MSFIKNLQIKFFSHKGFRKYFVNTAWMLTEQILRIAGVLLVGVWVARYLGPEQFGIFSYAIAFTSIIAVIAKLGLDVILVRDLVGHPEIRNAYLSTAFWLKLAASLLMIFCLAASISLITSDQNTNFYILILAGGIIFQSFEVIDFYFQSQVLSRYASICKIIQLGISTILKIVLVNVEAPLIYFVIVIVFDQISLYLTLFVAYQRQKLGSLFIHFNIALAKELLKTSWPLMLSGLTVALYMRLDQLMLKEMMGAKEVGLYSAGVRLSEAWYFIPVMLTSSMFPAMANAKKISRKLYLERLQQFSTSMTWMAIIIASLVTCFPELIIHLLYGDAFQDATQVLVIHVWGAIFVYLGIASGVFFTLENYTYKVLYRTILGLASNIALNLILIPRFGISGAAYATVISQFLVNFLIDFFDTSLKELCAVKTKSLFPIGYLKF